MTLIQIGLPRDRAHGVAAGATAADPAPSASTLSSEAAEGEYHADDPGERPGHEDSLAPASAGLALAGGLVVLAPLALVGRTSRGALLLLLVGLGVLALIAVLLRATDRADPA